MLSLSDVPEAPKNPILGRGQDAKEDKHPDRINLIIGAYRDDNGDPVVLDCVRQAEQKVVDAQYDHEYLTQDGLADFNIAAAKLMFGEKSKVLQDRRCHTMQTLSGTGSLRLGAEFIKKFLGDRIVCMPSTTWGNHPTIFNTVGLKIERYRYLDSSRSALDYEGMMGDLRALPKGSVVLFHACAHNPSGVDPEPSQWEEILEVVRTNELFPYFDSAYQGFVSGDPHLDAAALRSFAESGIPMMVSMSFSKNFGLYGERTGALHVVCDNANQTPAVASQLRVIARAIYSTCPAYGARLVATVLSDPVLRKLWEDECRGMAERILRIRKLLHEKIVAAGIKGSWGHVLKQRGMFSYTGMSTDAVVQLEKEHHVWLLLDGRISLAGLNAQNVDYMVESMARVLGTD